MEYIEPEDLIEIVDAITSFDYIHEEEVPKYDEERIGIDEYLSLIDRIRSDVYYPDLFRKATALFLQLNSTHYFSNGNKRIAAFSLIYFLNKNDFYEIGLTKDEYKIVFSEVFGAVELEDFENFSPTDFALYNLAIITAKFNEEGIGFDEGKEMVRVFLQRTFARV